MALTSRKFGMLTPPDRCPHSTTQQIKIYDTKQLGGGQVQIGHCPDCDSIMILIDNTWKVMEIKK